MRKIVLGFILANIIACGSEKTGTGGNFGAPKLAEIVDGAAPTALKGSSTSLYAPAFGLSCDETGSTVSCTSKEGFLDFIKSYVFKKDTTGKKAGPTYYRYWTDVVDSALAELNTRLSEIKTEEGKKRCYEEDATAVDFSIPVAGKTATVSLKFFCWENQTGPNSKQNFAFGKDSSNYYIAYRTKDDATTTGSGSRILLAKASADGSKADIWALGGTYQQVIGTSTTVQRYSLQRIIADKTAKTFTINHIEDPGMVGLAFHSFYGRSDGTSLYMEGRSYTATTGKVGDVTSFVPGTGACVSASDVAVTSTACTSLKTPPADFGFTTPVHDAAYTLSGSTVAAAIDTTTFKTAITTIEGVDYSGKGIREMSSDAK